MRDFVNIICVRDTKNWLQ